MIWEKCSSESMDVGKRAVDEHSRHLILTLLSHKYIVLCNHLNVLVAWCALYIHFAVSKISKTPAE